MEEVKKIQEEKAPKPNYCNVCLACGNSIRPDDRICPNCGTPIDD